MCGIAGLINLDSRRASESTLERMIDLIGYRGPDERGIHTDGNLGLAHARLSIIDLASGQQPMHSSSGRLSIVFNGEIFNHVELRRQLEQKGHRFHTHSDTEVILNLYEEKGRACVHDMNGQWAFAIWDKEDRVLFLSRDRLGIRPLYYTQRPGLFAFASEAKSLLSHPDVPRAVDPKALNDIFTIWSIVPPRTFYEGIRELPPGCSLTLKDGASSVATYWQLGYDSEFADADEEGLAEELRATLIDAARLRFQRADVPVGAYLSGGLDSTLITGIVRRFAEVPLKTFSVTFEDAEYDESEYQRRAINYLDVDHHQVLCRKTDIGASFPDVVWHTEQPVVRTAPTPLFLLSKLVRDRGFKVVLTGEGSDELLGGYDIFKEAKVRRFIAQQPGSSLRPKLLKRLYPYMPALQKQSPDALARFFRTKPEDLSSPFFSHLPRWALTAQNKLFFSPAVKDALRDYDLYDNLRGALPEGYGEWHPFCQAQYLESRYLLPGYLLSSQGDRMAMAHSVEGRFPFLDHRVAELAARVPPRLKMKVLDEKYLLKKAAGDLIPPFLRTRPKQPYRAPEALSFFDVDRERAHFDYVDEVLSESCLKKAGLFAPKPVQQLVAKARQGKVVGIRDAMALVSVLSAQLVFVQHIDGFGRTTHARRH